MERDRTWLPDILEGASSQSYGHPLATGVFALMPPQASTSAPPVTLSKKDIPPKDRLIVALDVPTPVQARKLIDQLGDSVTFYKLGLELFMAEGYFDLVKQLVGEGKKVFVDLKFFDVPQTVKSAVKQLSKHGAYFASVHGNDEILKAAAEAKNGLKILAVTVLTSLDQADIEDLGFKGVSVEDLVLSRAKRALKLGCSGVISSGQEAPKLRASYGEGFVIVVPGIRPVANVDDQKRTVDVEEAFENGADYIVVGRAIHGVDDPVAAAESIQARIAKLFS